MSHSPSLPSGLRQSWRLFGHLLLRDRRLMLLLVLLVLAVASSNTALIWAIGLPMNTLAANQTELLPGLLLLLAAVAVINQLSHFFSQLAVHRLGLRFVGRVRGELLANIMAVSYPISHQVSQGDLLSRLSHDVDLVEDLLVEQPALVLSHLLTLSFYGTMLVIIDWRLSLVALLALPPLIWLQRIFTRRKRVAAEAFLKRGARLLAFEENSLKNLAVISSLGAAAQIGRRHAESFAEAMTWALRERGLASGFAALMGVSLYLIGALVLYFGLTAVAAGELALGALVSFLLYLGYVSVPVRALVQVPVHLQSGLAAAGRLRQVLEARPQGPDRADAVEFEVGDGGIALERVTFAYPGAVPLLENLDLTLPGGGLVALVGPSGSGKSSLFALLTRFYVPEEGRLLIGGQDIAGVTLESLRAQVTVVWQQSVFFNDSLRNNLLLAKPEASDEELLAACHGAAADDVIAALPEGLDTLLGDGGVSLSGGQAQRLAIARALLRRPAILLLDEATSALDSENERRLMASLQAQRAGLTTIMISHRHSAIRRADLVIYLDHQGRVESGSHEALLARLPAYRQAVAWQQSA